MPHMNDHPCRDIPPTNEILEDPRIVDLMLRRAREIVLQALRVELAACRETLRADAGATFDRDGLIREVVDRIEAEAAAHWRNVINATGIVLHTNLGRAPLMEGAAQAAAAAGRGYLNLEIDLATGERSSRQAPIRRLLTQLTGAESATVVNNGAAATVIVLKALAAGREVIVSRGQMIEIGGSFRIPEIMAASGAILREVGTTNITRIGDYERAIGPNTALLMRIHPSNYRIRGFTESVSLGELVELGRKRNIPVVDDCGSGALLDLPIFRDEPIIPHSVSAGADVVICSGDKLLGGPQAGLIMGRRELIERIERDPLMRAFRLDKMTLAALEATLRFYLVPEQAIHDVPVLRMLTVTAEELQQSAMQLAERLRAIPQIGDVSVHAEEAFAGGGALPDSPLPSWVVSIKPERSENAFAEKLRMGRPAVVALVRDGRVLFDVRTILPGQESDLINAVSALLT